MASLNKVLLMGNLTKDPELRYTPGGSAVTDFGLAINRTFTSNGERKEETCFVDINVWGKQAESVSKYLQKGSPAFIEGRLQLDQWEDKESGKPRSRLRVVAERVQFIGSPKGGSTFDDQDAVGDYGNNSQQGYGYNQPFQSQPAVTGQVNAPDFPAPMPGPAQAPANNAFASQYPAQGRAPMQPVPGSPQFPAANSMTPQIPVPPDDAFDPSTETEDDIPF